MQAPQSRQPRKPYPVPDNLTPNRHRAALLLSLYSGRNSELTAITQYTYHHIELGRSYPDMARTLRGIATVEMHHLDMLGDCIRQLGAQPRYIYPYGGRQSYWNAGFVRYGRTPREMLEADRRGEQEAIAAYERAAMRIGEPNIERLIARILEDEQEHLAILERLIGSLEK